MTWSPAFTTNRPGSITRNGNTHGTPACITSAKSTRRCSFAESSTRASRRSPPAAPRPAHRQLAATRNARRPLNRWPTPSTAQACGASIT